MAGRKTAPEAPAADGSGGCGGPRGCAATAGLGEEAARALHHAGRCRVLHAGETLFHVGEPADGSLMLLCRGAVERMRAGAAAGTVAAGAALGLEGYLDRSPYASTIRALEPTAVLVVPGEAARALERRFPELAAFLDRALAARIRERAAPPAITGVLARPVSAVMSSPLAACAPDTPLARACEVMEARRVGSLAVIAGDGALQGLVTWRSLARALVGAGPEQSVAGGACRPVPTAPAATALWEAEELLRQHGSKYLVVVEDDRPAGIVSQTDILAGLLEQRSSALFRIRRAQDLATLARLHDELVRVAREAHETSHSPARAVRILSDVHRAIQRRCTTLVLERLRARHGTAPRSFAVLIMGSGGRREMLLDPDQDNGLIIDDAGGPPGPEEHAWFEAFAQALNLALEEVGYPLCPGEIMARNPVYRRTLGDWCRQLDRILRQPDQRAARWSSIVFDFDTLSGDDTLTRALRAHLLEGLQRERHLLGYMAEDDAEGRPAIGLFNRLIPTREEGEHALVDLKRNGLRIIADAARIYALGAGIAACNTGDRLQALVRQGVLDGTFVDSIQAAYEQLLELLLDHQIRNLEQGEAPGKAIPLEALGEWEREALRDAMRVIRRFQDQLQGDYGRTPF